MKKLVFFLMLSFLFAATDSQAGPKLDELLDRKEVQKKIRETIADQDVDISVDLGNLDLAEGISIGSQYRYDVEGSYINKFYTRVDKWNINTGINVGEVLKDFVDVPFSFSVNRSNSFFFVRQFPKKMEAMKALPYGPNRLPLNAKLALKNLSPGDFVSMPANLNIAVGLSASTSMFTPVVLSANAGTSFVLSGEYTVQVFKIDDTHVRLKILTKRGRDTSGSAGIGASFQFFGIRILDHEIDRLFERDLVSYGLSYNPGAQFIVDYVFDLSNKEAQDAYDQILSSTVKFKDVIVADMTNPKDLKDKLISSYEKADDLFAADEKLPPKDRRVQRIFKGFSSYAGHTRHIKLSFLITSYTKDRTFTESKVTFVDKNEKNLAFYYPTYSKYIESHFGKWIFDVKDQSFQNNFALIPRAQDDEAKKRDPDLGLTFERKDRYFSPNEQKAIERFMLGQIPAELAKKIDLSQWKDGKEKIDARIFFQLILKSQGFAYLKDFSAKELRERIVDYVNRVRKIHFIDDGTAENPQIAKLKNFLILNRFVEKKLLLQLADDLAEILKNSDNNSEEMTKKLVALNEGGVFDKIGVGFLISLLPQDKLQDLVYLKIEMAGKDLKGVDYEYGTLNYRALYKELTEVQSRLSNRSYDLRLSDADRNMEDIDSDHL